MEAPPVNDPTALAIVFASGLLVGLALGVLGTTWLAARPRRRVAERWQHEAGDRTIETLDRILQELEAID